MQAKQVIRACVHCGFCNATCPTYQLLSDELDGPRGRIYLIKDFLEGKEQSKNVQIHLDRCLQCLSCETTCPSGVQYGRLIDIGKVLVERRHKRSLPQRIMRFFIKNILPYPRRFSLFINLASIFPGILTKQHKLPLRASPNNREFTQQVQLLPGCVQSSLRPGINQAAISLLARLKIRAVETAKVQCCGSVQYHMGDFTAAKENMRRNMDIWNQSLDNGDGFIVSTATGCSKFIQEYEHIFQNDPDYAEKAKRISERFRDIGELLAESDLSGLGKIRKTVAFHSPCTLQHGLKRPGMVEGILRHCGLHLLSVDNEHICCGSAGTYSILQKELSAQLRQKKITSLEKNKPDVILTANMACLLHLNKLSKTPIYHWVEFIEAHNSSK